MSPTAAQRLSRFDGIEPEDLLWLDKLCEANGYVSPQIMGHGRYAVLSKFMFTVAIITGEIGDDYGYSNRWCFDNSALASAALNEWRERNFEGEPIGWHRHPDSGRRRPNGDAAKEYVNK